MKMILGSGTISNYGSYSNNCTRNQWPYKIPVNNLQDVQLYIEVGGIKPDAVQYQLIHTCGAYGGTIETLTTSSYIVGQRSDNYWYGVFKNFNNTSNPLTCFVIAITLTITGIDYIYFSDEFCIEECKELTELKGCYGNLDSKISIDRQGIYFGIHAGEDVAMGDETVKYEHKILLRDVELSLQSLKKTFKQGRTRNFRTETEDIYQVLAEFVPEWYVREIGAIYDRGEVYVGGTRYLVEGIQFEKIEDCKRAWKPTATLKESYYQSFSCELDPCAPLAETCCDPASLVATVVFEESGQVCCDPEIIDAEVFENSGV